MKCILIAIVSVFLLVSCGENKKEKIPQKAKEETVKNEKISIEKTNVVVDANGVANVLITTNDGMRFDIRKIRVKPGQKVKLTLRHTGKLDKRVMGHNVVILKKNVKSSVFAMKAAASKDNDYIPEGTTDVVVHTKMIGGGETIVIEFTAPEAGTYNYICSFPGQYAMMKGKLIVE